MTQLPPAPIDEPSSKKIKSESMYGSQMSDDDKGASSDPIAYSPNKQAVSARLSIKLKLPKCSPEKRRSHKSTTHQVVTLDQKNASKEKTL